MIPHRTPFILPLLYPTLRWRLPAEGNHLYLTFDDGPVPGPTEFVLETLARNNVTATFFCIGENIERNTDLFRRITREGHTAGNHTHHHCNGWRTESNAYLDDIRRCDVALQQVSPTKGATPFRPPYGRMTRAQIRALGSRPVIMWDVLTLDYNRRLAPDRCLRNTLRAVRPGSIIVYHDSYKAERNLMYGLPRLIEECLNRGYTFKPIPV
jgi:peptidoglycan/xylan/chitin deacetylase (PgdA/CDA1 family)